MIINHLLTGMILHVDVLLLTIIWRFLNQKDPFFLEKVYNLQLQETILLMVFDFQGSVKKTLPVHSRWVWAKSNKSYVYTLNILMPDGKLMEIFRTSSWTSGGENLNEHWFQSGFIKGKNLESHLKHKLSTPHIGAKMMLKSMFIKGCKLLRKKTS